MSTLEFPVYVRATDNASWVLLATHTGPDALDEALAQVRRVRDLGSEAIANRLERAADGRVLEESLVSPARWP